MKVLILLVVTASQCIRFHSCVALASPKITKRSLAGLWKLTGLSSNLPSVDDSPIVTSTNEQYYVKLNDDGSFQTIQGGTLGSVGSLLDELGVKQGMWDYRNEDGQLILAADRSSRDNNNDNDNNSDGQDTIFEGKVKLKQTDAIQDTESILMVDENTVHNQTITPSQQTTEIWLSVLVGWVRIGKFFYPKDHPAFFDTPIFQPTDVGTFQLHQILSNHPPQSQQQQQQRQDGNLWVEKFRRDDFTKTSFWLSSYPIPDPKPKGRWSIKYGKYVQDVRKPLTTKKKDRDPSSTADTTDDSPSIRVLKIEFYANYTFLVTQGVGTDFQLRGKWDIWGDERDVFWMQISRFGFGRQVSGSTYSEGQYLSHEDCKWYRGEIQRNEEDGGEIHVKGEVYLGKVTPFREALFDLREAHEDRAHGEEDDSEDDEDADSPDSPSTPDWSTNAFQ